jgi:hypothetical protein
MAKYRAREVVEAEEWNPGDPVQAAKFGISQYEMCGGEFSGCIHGIYGQQTLERGCWIVMGDKGMCYLSDATAFHENFEKVQD